MVCPASQSFGPSAFTRSLGVFWSFESVLEHLVFTCVGVLQFAFVYVCFLCPLSGSWPVVSCWKAQLKNTNASAPWSHASSAWLPTRFLHRRHPKAYRESVFLLFIDSIYAFQSAETFTNCSGVEALQKTNRNSAWSCLHYSYSCWIYHADPLPPGPPSLNKLPSPEQTCVARSSINIWFHEVD